MILATCAEVDLDGQYIRIKMIGVLEKPGDATGGFEPISQTYKFTKLTLTLQNGNTEVFEPGKETKVRISNRLQEVYKKAIISEQIGRVYDSAEITFDPAITGISKYEDKHSLSLDNPIANFNSGFAISKGKSLTFVVKVKWKGTITRDESSSPPKETMSQPSLEISIDEDV